MQRLLRIMLVGRSGSRQPLRRRILDVRSLELIACCVASEGDVRALAREFSPDSNLSYLARLSVDRLKLDKSLIHRMGGDRKIAAVVHAVIALGAQLDVAVMAEGVETESQLSMLRDFGCTHAQGFLLARPTPAVQAQIAWRKRWGNLAKGVHAAARGHAQAH